MPTDPEDLQLSKAVYKDAMHPKQYDSKFKDFLIQTHTDHWKRFYLDPAKFDGSVETLDVLLRDLSLEQTEYEAAAKKAIASTYDAHLRSLSEFLRKIIPEKYKAFDSVHIRLDRFSFYAEVELSFT
ncbi:hypothetical protein PLESTB_000402700 [Pleodorina starrii]|uniref:Uncharacterized protein n=1 Tax=Pleodorina starrii TaxID=330485 RepID=A0A9W6BF50_9CHLO|nr:hypothetical protein PLESTB_000402700 [Pleodorina starrii]